MPVKNTRQGRGGTPTKAEAIVAAFFSDALDDGKKIDLDSVAGNYENVIKKTVYPAQGTRLTE
ncbi:hypothetical protein WSM22_18220 [Cytophagales bacterium WSM2-2]|nr:hypothetical protein WSM22_18220 [Cytophagales bacterium WSM2-2]